MQANGISRRKLYLTKVNYKKEMLGGYNQARQRDKKEEEDQLVDQLELVKVRMVMVMLRIKKEVFPIRHNNKLSRSRIPFSMVVDGGMWSHFTLAIHPW
jgi:hypothetical protein